MNCFVITLKSDKPRYQRVLQIKKNSNFNIKVIDAIDGKTIDKNFFNFLIQKKAITKVTQNLQKIMVVIYHI